MNINWRKVLIGAERVIRIIRKSLPITESTNIHGKHHKGDHSHNNNRNKKEMKHDFH